MATPSKTAAQTGLALQSIGTAVVIGSDLTMTTTISAFFGIHFGRRATTALTAAFHVRLEASTKTSGVGFWWPLFSWDSDIATCSTQAVSGTVNAGTNVITVSSTTGFTVGSLIYIDNGTIANSEWGRQKALSTNVSVTIEDNLNNAQTGSNMYTAAQFIQCVLDVSMFTRMRVVADGKDAGQNCAVEVLYTTCDSFG